MVVRATERPRQVFRERPQQVLQFPFVLRGLVREWIRGLDWRTKIDKTKNASSVQFGDGYQVSSCRPCFRDGGFLLVRDVEDNFATLVGTPRRRSVRWRCSDPFPLVWLRSVIPRVISETRAVEDRALLDFNPLTSKLFVEQRMKVRSATRMIFHLGAIVLPLLCHCRVTPSIRIPNVEVMRIDWRFTTVVIPSAVHDVFKKARGHVGSDQAVVEDVIILLNQVQQWLPIRGKAGDK